jgi:DNA-binding NarL/FixJ family response regulator/HPt (histidine-containing phosphotransfer) domain-containing protein
MEALQDFDEFESSDAKAPAIALVAIVSEEETIHKLDRLEADGFLALTKLDHSAEPDILSPGLILFEIRLMEAFEDLNLLRSWRQKRPLQPIIAYSSNDDEDFILEAFKSGATNYLLSSLRPEILSEHLKNLYKLSEAPRLVEIQNSAMLRSMDAERLATEAKIRAEADRKLAIAQAEANQRTQDIMDNLHEGFFMIESNLRVSDSTSKSCLDIFCQPIAGAEIGDALGLSAGQEEFLRNAVEQLFEDFMPLEVNLSLLPKKLLTRDNRILGFTYTPILAANKSPEKLIIEAVDLTESIRLQEAFEKTQRLNEALLRILSDKEPFRDFLKDSKKELELLAGDCDEVLAKRLLHTLKGNSSVMGLESVAHLVHTIESDFDKITPAAQPSFLEVAAAEIEKEFEKFLQKHAEILQISWTENRNSYALTEAELNFLRFYVKHDHENQREMAERILSRLSHRSIKSILVGFDMMTLRLSEQLSKQVRFKLVGGQHKLDPHVYGPLFKSLVHAREALGKNPEGYVQFKFERTAEKTIRISIQDDGGGIRVEKIRQKAVEKGLYTALQAQQMSREDILLLIFKDGLSTAEHLSETSGRGVGMACIRKEVEALKGTIEIKSREGVGTLTRITVPDQTSL